MSEENIVLAETIAAIKAESDKPAPVEKTVKITEENKEAFFKAFLSDTPYIEKIPLFNGKSNAVFKTLNIEENDVVFKQIQFDQAKGIARSDDSYLIKIIQYRLSGCLVSVDDVLFCEDITVANHVPNKEDGTTYLSERMKVTQKWHTFKLGGITEAFNMFEAKVRELTKEIFKESF